MSLMIPSCKNLEVEAGSEGSQNRFEAGTGESQSEAEKIEAGTEETLSETGEARHGIQPPNPCP